MKGSTVLNSELAVKVLKEIANSEGGDYGSNLAEELGKSQASISRILSQLYEEGFLEKGKRQKAQYYEIDYESVANFWFKEIYEGMRSYDENFDEDKWLEEGVTSKEEVVRGLEENEKQIKSAVENYIKNVLQSSSNLQNLTFSDLLFECFAYSIGHNIIEDGDFLSENRFLEYPKEAMVRLLNVYGFPSHLKEALR